MERLLILLCCSWTVSGHNFLDNDSVDVDLVLDKNSFSLDQYKRAVGLEEAARLLEGQELVVYVNSRQNLWKSKLHTRIEAYNKEVKLGLMGVNHVRNSVKARKQLALSRFLDLQLPREFDSRTQWPECESIRHIRDQSSCGSCWAFGAAEAISDRICVASKGREKPAISSADLLSCCRDCGYGCNGGEPYEAWEFWVTDGLVTGADFHSRQGCRPYPLPPCEHHSNHTGRPQCKKELYPTPKCVHECQPDYNRSYGEDKYYGEKAYAVHNSVEAIQKELFTNGPLEVSFEVYTDFLTYASGVYVHQGGHLGGGHAVKLVGWGEDNNVPYWIVANSWNTDWGEGGFFRILRGADECGIESGVVGGLPKLSRAQHPKRDYDIF